MADADGIFIQYILQCSAPKRIISTTNKKTAGTVCRFGWWCMVICERLHSIKKVEIVSNLTARIVSILNVYVVLNIVSVLVVEERCQSPNKKHALVMTSRVQPLLFLQGSLIRWIMSLLKNNSRLFSYRLDRRHHNSAKYKLILYRLWR